MLTTAGKNHIKRYLAQLVPAIAGAMAFGVGTRTEVGGDFGLNFEAVRVEIASIVYDFANNQIVYKATIPPDFAGTIEEIGLYSLFQDPQAGQAGTRLVTDINQGEPWVQSTTTTTSAFTSTGSRIGADGLSQTPAASATRNDSLTNLLIDLSAYSSADFITVAANIGNSNTSSASVFFKTDASNHYKFSLPSVTSGYKIVDFLKSAATVTGSPDWGNITEIQLQTISTGGGASAVTWDGILMQDTDTGNLDYTLVARKVLASPIVVALNQSQDVEFALDVTV